MVVGDADQSIYAFRGANIRNILDFEQDFPNATSILLEQNYRSTQTILNAANAVIGHNKGRKPKRLWSDAGDGERIVGYVADDEHDEARFVSEEIDKLTDDAAAKPADVAVFYRTNAQSRVFEEVFIRRRHALQGRRRGALLRAARGPRRARLPADAGQPGRRDLAAAGAQHPASAASATGRWPASQALAERERITFWEALRRRPRRPGWRPGRSRRSQGFVGLVEELQSMVDAGERPDVILESVLERTGYLAELEASDDPQDDTRVENLAELVAVAREFSDDPVAGPSADPADVDAGTVAPGLGRLPRAGGAGRRHRPDPRRSRGRRRRGGHPDDAAHREGAGVPGRVPDRARGRRLPARPLAGRPARARGGAPAGLRRRHPRPAAALRLAGGGPLRLGRARPTTRRPASSTSCRSTSSTGAAPRPPQTSGAGPTWPAARPPRLGHARPPRAAATSPRPRSADAAAKAKPAREIPSLEPGDRVVHDSFGMGTVVALEGVADKAVASIDFGSRGRQAAAAALRAGREALVRPDSASQQPDHERRGEAGRRPTPPTSHRAPGAPSPLAAVTGPSVSGDVAGRVLSRREVRWRS